MSDSVYTERTMLIAALARLVVQTGGRAGVKLIPVDSDGWEPDYGLLVFIDLPTGQASWHVHDNDTPLLYGLPTYTSEWDNHTTPEKYRRLHEAFR